MELAITEGLAPQEETEILERLKAYNLETFGESDRRDLYIPLYDDKGAITGGLVGYTGRGWLYTSMLFVPQELRGRGLAGRMLDMAEQEARRRGCIGAYIDTMNPQARQLYLRQGYREIGSLQELAGGHAVTWLEKRFASEPASGE
ncbi:GNAT family N-acetyltransferase [Neorhizobium lilium]|uniref:GNAT family N-acetyltransferase n=1 Tax=Neorhizobium lilium TaxID=2503024 RepID=A0A444LI12_9HYPH|nr:GNAT family N-acetyltransferase [Neorhizobium lilium]RWX78658.1 GNAT family N-acetyltransferase [Neorhizobium lilium]